MANRRGNKEKTLGKIATEGNLTESLSLRCIFLEKQKLPQSFLENCRKKVEECLRPYFLSWRNSVFRFLMGKLKNAKGQMGRQMKLIGFHN